MRADTDPTTTEPDAALREDALRLHRALLDLKRVYRFQDRDQICCHDISITGCWALEALARRGALTLNELAAELYLEKSTASRVVTTLEGKGYVERGRHPDDGRAILLRATPQGVALYRRIEEEMLREEATLLADFDPEVRRGISELVARLAGAAAARVETGGGKCCRID